jgi:hypothetical protein
MCLPFVCLKFEGLYACMPFLFLCLNVYLFEGLFLSKIFTCSKVCLSLSQFLRFNYLSLNV